jgi:hypothetical protein
LTQAAAAGLLLGSFGRHRPPGDGGKEVSVNLEFPVMASWPLGTRARIAHA